MSAKEIQVTDNPQIRKNIWDNLASTESFPGHKKLPDELTAEEFAEKYEISVSLAQSTLRRWFAQGKVSRRLIVDSKRRFYVYLPCENVNIEK